MAEQGTSRPTQKERVMDTYYNPADLTRFSDIGKNAPEKDLTMPSTLKNTGSSIGQHIEATPADRRGQCSPTR